MKPSFCSVMIAVSAPNSTYCAARPASADAAVTSVSQAARV